MDEQKSSKPYFPTLSGKELADALWEKKRQYERFVDESGLLALWRKMHFRYFGIDPFTGLSDKEVARTGDKGEVHNLHINHLRADITIWLNLASSQRNEVEPETDRDDYEGELEAQRAKCVIQHWRNKAGLETALSTRTEFAGVYGLGYLLQLWNPNRGEDVPLPDAELPVPPMDAPPPPMDGGMADQPPPEMGTEPITEPILATTKKKGAVEAFALHPLDVFIDIDQTKPVNDWHIARIWRNKFDLIADYAGADAGLAEKILNTPPPRDNEALLSRPFDNFSSARRLTEHAKESDLLATYYFFHEDRPSCPGGKQAVFLPGGTILFEAALKPTYERPPINRLAPAEWHESPFGYSPAFGLLAPQEASNSMTTIALTNARTFGLGVIISPKGSDVDDNAIAQGLMLIEYTPGLEPPRALQMPRTAQEDIIFARSLVDSMGGVIGVNSVVRGNPEASLKSGSALALVQATAVQFSSDFQGAIIIASEAVHLDTIKISSQNMEEEYQLDISGAQLAPLIKPFTGSHISRIVRVRVPTVSPMLKTLAGRVQIADTILERFPGALPLGDYFRLLQTGNIDPMLRPQAQRERNLDRENEMLAAGRVPTALITDQHRVHYMKHLDVLENPHMRESQDPEAEAVRKAVLAHCDEHKQFLSQMTVQFPELLELTNQMPLQAALPPPMPGAAPGGPPGDGPHGQPKGHAPLPKNASLGMPQPPGAAQQPHQPNMPVNPATGERAEPPGPP